MRAWRALWLVLCCGLVQSAPAAEITPLKNPLPAIAGKEVVLTIANGNARIALTLADIESLPMRQTVLRTPWGRNGVYQGVLLSDLLAAHNLKVTGELEIRALDNYVSRIPAEKLRGRALLATRFDGKPIPLSSRGPLILLWPEEEQAVLKRGVAPHSWVWSISQFALR